MRMRHKKHGEERILACSEFLIPTPETNEFGKSIDTGAPVILPREIFGNDLPVALEIGCGKGGFAIKTAKAHPEVNIIAMERVPDVACIALERAIKERYGENGSEDSLKNLRFLIGNAENLSAWLPPHSIDCIYLNFSDPWPKKGYAKRRLTYRRFLEIYRGLLKENGILRFKTDNVGLFDFSLESFEEFGCTVEWMTRDLHNSDRAEGNVMTEYEKNWSEKGYTINSAIVRFN